MKKWLLWAVSFFQQIVSARALGRDEIDANCIPLHGEGGQGVKGVCLGISSTLLMTAKSFYCVL